MKFKTVLIGSLIVSTLAMSVGAASAQTDSQPGQEAGFRQRIRNAAAGVLMDTITEATGLQPGDVVAQWREDGTLADVITANGGDPEVVVADAVATATAAINARVDAGRLTREQADQLIERVSNGFETALQRESPLPQAGNRIERYVLAQAADQTGLSVQDILGQIQDGSSLASVLEANGVDTSAFIDGLIVTAETRANARLAQLRVGLTNRINQPGGGN